MRIILCLLLIFEFGIVPLAASEIRVGVLMAPKQRSAYNHIFEIFTEETGIRIRTIAKSDADYKKALNRWLSEENNHPDVLYWQASQRLFAYAKQGVIHPITDLWNEENLDQHLSHVKSGVMYDGEVYALPFSYYHWGIFYKKSLIEKHGGVPTTWEAFVSLGQRLLKAGITPIGIGTKNNWPAAAWFDYINLRMNGLTFHQQVLRGEVSFHDPRVQEVLQEWKKLIDQRFFNDSAKLLTWDEVLPQLYREQIGFFLIGNFVTNRFSEKLIQDIEFMPFPKIRDIPLYEEAPMDVFMIPKNTKNRKNAEAFIKFLSRAEIQSQLNQGLGYLPPHKEGTVGQDRFIQSGAKLLNQAKGVAQYFDRDTLPEFDKRAVPILADFLSTGNLKEVTEKLEQARKDVFSK